MGDNSRSQWIPTMRGGLIPRSGRGQSYVLSYLYPTVSTISFDWQPPSRRRLITSLVFYTVIFCRSTTPLLLPISRPPLLNCSLNTHWNIPFCGCDVQIERSPDRDHSGDSQQARPVQQLGLRGTSILLRLLKTLC